MTDSHIILELDHSSHRLECVRAHRHTHTHLGVIYLIKTTSFIRAGNTRTEMLLNDKCAKQ